MTRQRPFADDIATGTPTVGFVPISAGAGAPPAWGAAGGGSFALLYSTTITTPSESSILLPASGALDQTYKNLELRAQVAVDFDDGSGDAARVFVRFNGSTFSYNSALHVYDRPTIGGIHITEGGPAGTEALIGRVAPLGFADEASILVAHINNYSGSLWRKHILSRCSTLWGSASDCFEYQGTAVWRQTDPITDITIWTDGVMLEGSTFQVYGLAG